MVLSLPHTFVQTYTIDALNHLCETKLILHAIDVCACVRACAYMYVHVCVRALRACVRACAHVRACVRVCFVHVCTRAWLYVYMCVRERVRVSVCVKTVPPTGKILQFVVVIRHHYDSLRIDFGHSGCRTLALSHKKKPRSNFHRSCTQRKYVSTRGSI